MTASRVEPTSAHIVANMRVGEPHRLRELTSGIDALYLSARAVLSPTFLERLEERRRWAGQLRVATPLEIGDEIFAMAPHPWSRYRYCLEHRVARVGLTVSRHLPTVRVQPRAETLHSLGPKGTAALAGKLLEPELGTLSWSVSRVDVFGDWQGWAFSAADAQRFSCRADARRTFEEQGRLTGFGFGSRKSKALYARVYDKSADMAKKGTTWWADIWGDAYRDTDPVWRVEFEFAREALIEFDLSGVDEVLAGAGDLWRYAAGEWLTLREPAKDTNRSRWPLAPEWRQVQQASLTSRLVGADRIARARRKASIARLLPGLTGYLASLAAVVGTEDVDDTVVAAVRHLRDYEAVSRTRFAERVERKREAMGPP